MNRENGRRAWHVVKAVNDFEPREQAKLAQKLSSAVLEAGDDIKSARGVDEAKLALELGSAVLEAGDITKPGIGGDKTELALELGHAMFKAIDSKSAKGGNKAEVGYAMLKAVAELGSARRGDTIAPSTSDSASRPAHTSGSRAHLAKGAINIAADALSTAYSTPDSRTRPAHISGSRAHLAKGAINIAADALSTAYSTSDPGTGPVHTSGSRAHPAKGVADALYTAPSTSAPTNGPAHLSEVKGYPAQETSDIEPWSPSAAASLSTSIPLPAGRSMNMRYQLEETAEEGLGVLKNQVIQKGKGTLKASELVPRLVVRGLQLLFAIIACAFYGNRVDADRKGNDGFSAEWLSAIIIAGLSAVTSIVSVAVASISTIPCISSVGRKKTPFEVHWAYVFDLILCVAWLVMFAIFAGLFLKRESDDKYKGSSTGAMKTAVWVDLVNAILWLGTGIYGAARAWLGEKVDKWMVKLSLTTLVKKLWGLLPCSRERKALRTDDNNA